MVPAGTSSSVSPTAWRSISDQADVVLVNHGNKGNGTAVDDDLAVGDGPVGQHHALQGQVDLQAAKDDASRWLGPG